MQLEIPYETVLHAIAMCQRLGVFTILDPAPAPHKLPRAMYGVDVFTPNQTEAETLLGMSQPNRVKRKGVIDPKQMASELLSRGPRRVVLKLGNKGAMLLERNGEIEQARPLRTKVVDTTAAGDAFCAGLAVAIAEGDDYHRATHFANAAARALLRAFWCPAVSSVARPWTSSWCVAAEAAWHGRSRM